MIINNYELIALLGEDTFGKAFKVKDNKGNFFIIKALWENLLPMEELQKNFTYLKKVYHPNLAEIITFGEIPKSFILENPDYINTGFFYIRPFYEGESIIKSLKSSEFYTISHLTIKILNTILFLSKLNLCIFNLQPGNVIVDKKGNLKILDYGFLNADFPNKLTIGDKNYIYFLSLFRIHREKYTTRDDLYSLVILLLKILAEKLPFENMNLIELINYMLNFKILDYIKNYPAKNEGERYILKLSYYILSKYFNKTPNALQCSIKYTIKLISLFLSKNLIKGEYNFNYESSDLLIQCNKILEKAFSAIKESKIKWINIHETLGNSKSILLNHFYNSLISKNIRYFIFSVNLEESQSILLQKVALKLQEDFGFTLSNDNLTNKDLMKKIKNFLSKNNIFLILTLTDKIKNILPTSQQYFLGDIINNFLNEKCLLVYIYHNFNNPVIKSSNILNYLYKSADSMNITIENLNFIETCFFVKRYLTGNYMDYYLSLSIYKFSRGNQLFIREIIDYIVENNYLNQKKSLLKLDTNFSLEKISLSDKLRTYYIDNIAELYHPILLKILKFLSISKLPIRLSLLKSFDSKIDLKELNYLVENNFLSCTNNHYFKIKLEALRKFLMNLFSDHEKQKMHLKAYMILKKEIDLSHFGLDLINQIIYHLNYLNDNTKIIEVLILAVKFATQKIKHNLKLNFLTLLEKHAEKSGDEKNILLAKIKWAEHFFSTSEYHKTEEILTDLLEYIQGKRNIDATLKIDIYNLAGEMSEAKKDFILSKKYFKKAYNLLSNKSIKNDRYIITKNNIWSLENNEDKNLPKIIDEMERFTTKNQKYLNNNLYLWHSYLILGNAYLNIRNYRGAYKSWKKCYDLCKGKSKLLESNSLNNLGVYFSVKNNLPKYLSYVQKSYDIELASDKPSKDLIKPVNIISAAYNMGFTKNAYETFLTFDIDTLMLNDITKKTLVNTYPTMSNLLTNSGFFNDAHKFALAHSRLSAYKRNGKFVSLIYDSLIENFLNFHIFKPALNTYKIMENHISHLSSEDKKYDFYYLYYYKMLLDRKYGCFNLNQEFLEEINAFIEDDLSENYSFTSLLLTYEEILLLRKYNITDSVLWDNIDLRIKFFQKHKNTLSEIDQVYFYVLLAIVKNKSGIKYLLEAEKQAFRSFNFLWLRKVYATMTNLYIKNKDYKNSIIYFQKYLKLERKFVNMLDEDYRKYYSNPFIENTFVILKGGFR